MQKIAIHTDDIQLDQFLKIAGAVMTGGEVKMLIADGLIKKNGVVETARRRKLVPGDVVEVDGAGSYEVTHE
ncbi:MAG: RNA-binding S4 domain-containing protein [Veillonellaceae bacterium]|nr:RNA-binding S4 domain-containing protein [Veillonellaceae bacterium]MDD6923885.1 RNA-binding S4 domain-containing protein [Veillonellaceae bacterium]